jgi:hypothetical protein
VGTEGFCLVGHHFTWPFIVTRHTFQRQPEADVTADRASRLRRGTTAGNLRTAPRGNVC